jgi:enoyl-CoA hydratase/carnithine racemase
VPILLEISGALWQNVCLESSAGSSIMAEIVTFPDAARAEGGGLLTRSLRDGVLRLVLDNPPANVLSIALLEALMEELETAGAEPDVRVVVIASTGNVFSAGHDLKELTAHRGDEDHGAGFFEKTFRLCADLMLKIAHLPKPVIAEIDGLATAAGCQLVASCDLAICTDSSTFCTPGVNIGLFCSTPMVAVSRAAHRKQAMEMLLTGETIDASTAKDFGLVNRIVPKPYLAQVVSKYAAVIASKSPLTLKIGKEAFHRQLELPVEAAYDYTARVMVENMLTQDAQEGIGAFLGKRKPEWTGE